MDRVAIECAAFTDRYFASLVVHLFSIPLTEWDRRTGCSEVQAQGFRLWSFGRVDFVGSPSAPTFETIGFDRTPSQDLFTVAMQELYRRVASVNPQLQSYTIPLDIKALCGALFDRIKDTETAEDSEILAIARVGGVSLLWTDPYGGELEPCEDTEAWNARVTAVTGIPAPVFTPGTVAS